MMTGLEATLLVVATTFVLLLGLAFSFEPDAGTGRQGLYQRANRP